MLGYPLWGPLQEFYFLGNFSDSIKRKTYFLKKQFWGAQRVSNVFPMCSQSINKGSYKFSKVEKISKYFQKMIIQVKLVNFPENFQGAPGAPPEPPKIPKLIWTPSKYIFRKSQKFQMFHGHIFVHQGSCKVLWASEAPSRQR